MKFYNVDKLLIGEIGTVRFFQENGRDYNKFIPTGIAIVEVYSDYKYENVITNQQYKKFGHYFCEVGDDAVLKTTSLSLFIQEAYQKIDNNTPYYKMFKRIIKTNKISNKDINILLSFFNDNYVVKNITTNSNNNQNNSNNSQLDLNYNTILTDKKFKNEPAIGRDNEVNELIISLAQDKKLPILVGPSGTGKTTIIDELAYKIQKNDVPKFLKNKQIIELDITSLIAGTMYVGTLEEKVNKLITYAVEKDAIVFIDEIHTIYGAGSTSKSDNDVAGMIKHAIDRKGLKVIGTTTTEEYDKYLSYDALKRRFEKVLVKEPDNNTLYRIIDKVFKDYSKNNNIKLLNNMGNIISILAELTNNDKHRTWNDKVCNPDLVIGIIDRIFADAKIHDQNKLTMENVIYGIESCNRLYDSSKEDAISNLDIKIENKPKIIRFNNLREK